MSLVDEAHHETRATWPVCTVSGARLLDGSRCADGPCRGAAWLPACRTDARTGQQADRTAAAASDCEVGFAGCGTNCVDPRHQRAVPSVISWRDRVSGSVA